MAELRGPHLVELGQTIRVGRKHDLPERRKLEELSEHRRRAGADVADGQADIDVHVRIQVREPSGKTVVRIAVQ